MAQLCSIQEMTAYLKLWQTFQDGLPCATYAGSNINYEQETRNFTHA